jgi:hypothetical protein
VGRGHGELGQRRPAATGQRRADHVDRRVHGTDPAPTLAQFKHYVAEHEIHYFVGTNSDSFGGGSGPAAQITAWVKAHFHAQTVGDLTVYDLSQPTS